MSRPRFLADEDLRFEIVLAVRRMEAEEWANQVMFLPF
jgi:hypothetical protein